MKSNTLEPIGVEVGMPWVRDRLLGEKRGALFLGDWTGMVFMHFEVEGAALQRQVPFELDRFQGNAYVSLVFFTMNRFRPGYGGRLGAWLFRPVRCHRFLNVRTYVRHEDEPGIYFMAEFVTNPLCVLMGPVLYSLPYRAGWMTIKWAAPGQVISGRVRSPFSRAALSFDVTHSHSGPDVPCASGSLAEFLLERYVAYTGHGRRRRRFRIRHEPWAQRPAAVCVADEGLLDMTGAWHSHTRPAGAHVSAGVRNVEMGWPQRV